MVGLSDLRVLSNLNDSYVSKKGQKREILLFKGLMLFISLYPDIFKKPLASKYQTTEELIWACR